MMAAATIEATNQKPITTSMVTGPKTACAISHTCTHPRYSTANTAPITVTMRVSLNVQPRVTGMATSLL